MSLSEKPCSQVQYIRYKIDLLLANCLYYYGEIYRLNQNNDGTTPTNN